MDPLVILSDTQVHVSPGTSAQVGVRIRNLGNIVEGYSLTLLGPVAAWSVVSPPEVSVYPGQEASVSVVFSPPAVASTPAGSVPFGLRVVSTVDPSTSVVVEGDLVVGGIGDVAGELFPNRSRGRWRARHRVAVVNRGNVPARVVIRAADDNGALTMSVDPAVVDVAPGGTGEALLKVKTNKPYLRGQPQLIPFTVVGEGLTSTSAGAPPQRWQVPGAFQQVQIISRGIMGVTALLAAAVIVLAVLATRESDPEVTQGTSVTPPAVPSDFVVNPQGTPTAVSMTWTRDPTVSGYVVEQLQDGTETQPEPVVLEPNPVDPAQNSFEASELEPGLRYCFRLVAVRGEARSVPTEPQCASTPTVAPFSAPSGVMAAFAPETGQVAVTWTHENPPGTSFFLYEDNRQLASPIQGTNTTFSTTPGPHCYRVQATTADGAASELSPEGEQACVTVSGPTTTAPPTAPTTTPPSGGGGGGGGGGDPTTTTTATPATSAPAGPVAIAVIDQVLEGDTARDPATALEQAQSAFPDAASFDGEGYGVPSGGQIQAGTTLIGFGSGSTEDAQARCDAGVAPYALCYVVARTG